MRKRILSFFLCVVVCVGALPVGTLAAGRDVTFEESLARDLKTLNLFKGVSETEFDLKRAPTRIEALVMLIRTLGKEQEALSGSWTHPFTDVPSWAEPYVGYAYQNGLANGVAKTEFGTSDATANQYLTFVLRALGYSDANGADFTWNNPNTLATSVGILPAGTNLRDFWRADVVRISYAALSAYLKNSSTTLAQKLITAGTFTQAQFSSRYKADAFASGTPLPGPTTNVGELTAEQIYSKCSPAVAYVTVYNKKGELTASGSGFFINGTGALVTNYHVINGCTSAQVETSDTNRKYNVLGVYHYSAEEDWAVLQVNCNGNAYLEAGDSSSVVGGAAVYAIGSPLGLQNTISQGIVSNPARVDGGITYIQTNAAISHGSSGGALIDKYGKVIGITSASYSDGQNLNLALPLSYVDRSTGGNYVTLDNLGPKKTSVEDPLALLQAYIYNYGDANYLSTDDKMYITYMLTTTGSNGHTYTFNFNPDNGVTNFQESYSTKYFNVSTTLFFYADNSVAFATYSYLDTIYARGCLGSGYVYPEMILDPNSFCFNIWGGKAPLSQADAETECYHILVDMVYTADALFASYGLPITMEDFGYEY